MKLLSTFSLVSLLIGFFLLPVPARSQNSVGYDFLRTFVGARPSAMAGAFISVQGDIHSLAYNPAGLAALDSKQGTASYLNHLLDFQSGFLAYAQPFALGTAAIGLHFFDYGQFERKDENNLGSGEFGANSMALSVGYSRVVLKNLAVGGAEGA